MPNLETQYLGLSLKNPVIVASSGLTKSVDKIVECEKAGAGAVVVKSLFEEVIAEDSWNIGDSVETHPEAFEYLRAQLELQYGSGDYMKLVKEAKSNVDIPVIPSINCVSDKWWPKFAEQLQQAGADALELNVYQLTRDKNTDSAQVEELYYKVLEQVKLNISIPVALKIGMNFSALPHFVHQLERRQLNGLVLFNRFTEPDIDIHNLKLKTQFSFSTEDEVGKVLRWVAILSEMCKIDISATTGVHSYETIAKLLLAGASTVQLASVLYTNGLGVIQDMLNDLSKWMDAQSFQTVSDFQGRLGFEKVVEADMYLRSQFMEKISNID